MNKPLRHSVVVENVDFDSLVDAIAAAFEKRLEGKLATESGPRFADRQEMADALRISLPMLDDWVKRGKIPSKLIGSRRVFDRAAVLASIPDA